ncbi:MAG: hypothetical protein V1890_07555 [Candidatus Zixiibacteriota bacterium]
MSSNLLNSYHKLLKEYNKVLILTDKLLSALQSGETDDDFIDLLIEKRLKSVKLIQKITDSISNYNPSNSQKPAPQIIEQLKTLHRELEDKANLLQEKEKGLEKIVENLS